MEGGDEDANVRFSYTNSAIESMLPNSSLDRNNFSIRAFSKMSDKLSFDGKITYLYSEGKNRPQLGTEGVIADLYSLPRNVRLEDLKDFQNDDLSVSAPNLANPYWVVNHDRNDDTRERTLGFFKINYDFFDGLSAFVRVGGDITRQKIERVNQFGHWFYGKGRLIFGENRSREVNADFLVTYAKDYSSNVSFSVNFGGNFRNDINEDSRVVGEGFKIPTQVTFSNTTTLTPSYSFERQKQVQSLYGSAQISYEQTYFLDVTVRNDWSSTLPAANRSFFYPSVSLSVLINEVIDMDHNLFDLLKVRASWAQVGNDTDPFQLDNTFSIAQNGYLGRTTLDRSSTLFDVNIRPEEVSTYEFGLEWNMFGNKLYGDFTYYDIVSRDLIWRTPVSSSTGYETFNTNIGEINNKGLELLIGGRPFITNDFTWDISFNIARNKNKLVELIEDLDSYTFSDTNAGVVAVQATAGGGFGDIFGNTYARTEDGQLILNADGLPTATSERVHLGNYQPDLIGGVSNTFRYKDLSFKFLIDARIGGEVYSAADAALDASGASERSLTYREEGILVEGVVNTGTAEEPVYTPNTTKVTAQAYWGAYSGISSNYVYDQTNIRLREVSLLYRFDNLLKNSFIQNLSVGLVGRNLFFLMKKIDNFDPESSYSTTAFSQGVLFYNMPSMRNMGVVVNLKL